MLGHRLPNDGPASGTHRLEEVVHVHVFFPHKMFSTAALSLTVASAVHLTLILFS